MMPAFLFELAICLSVLPAHVLAQTVPVLAKDPLNYPLRQYGFILGVSLLGGFVGWVSKVRKGRLPAGSLMALVGELTTSAFAGLIVFWACEYFSIPPVLTACLAGLAGHAGGNGVAWLEELAKSKASGALGIAMPPEEGERK